MPRRTNADATDLLWAYRVECQARSPRMRRLRKLLEHEDEDLRAREELWEAIETAPAIPIDSDGASWVTLKVDLTLPPSFVLPKIECWLRWLHDSRKLRTNVSEDTRLREIFGALKAEQPRNPFASLRLRGPRRIQVKTLRLRLTVWDMAKQGATFKAIATRLRKPVSTIRDLYEKVAADILDGPSPRGRRGRLLIGFDSKTHLSTCPTCMKAMKATKPKEADFCPEWRAYLGPAELKEWDIHGKRLIAESTRDKHLLPSTSRKTPTYDTDDTDE